MEPCEDNPRDSGHLHIRSHLEDGWMEVQAYRTSRQEESFY